VAQVTKEETAKYKSTEIIPNRETLRATIAKRLTDELKADSITVDDFLLTNVHFSDAFNATIEAKVQAEQNAATEQNNVAIHQAKAAQNVADAQGVADAAVVSAKGQAQANDLINASLTPALIQYATVNKLAPDVKVILLPAGGAGMILNLGDLTGSTAAATP
jgi:regulator of protease activity HflC (stomatin/prohibitin superfamily)